MLQRDLEPAACSAGCSIFIPGSRRCRNLGRFGICREAWIEHGQKKGRGCRGLKALFNRCLLLWLADGALKAAAVHVDTAAPAARTRSLLSLHHLTSKRQPGDRTDISSAAGTRLAVSESKLCALADDTQLLDSYASADCNVSAAPAAAKARLFFCLTQTRDSTAGPKLSGSTRRKNFNLYTSYPTLTSNIEQEAVRMEPNTREGRITIDLERSEQEIHVLEDAIHYKSNLAKTSSRILCCCVCV